MAYKVIKGKNKIRGEQTFVDNITGSVISASAYYGATFTGKTVSGSTGLFSVVSASAVLVNGSPISIDTGSLLITASIANDTITFTKGNSSTFPLTINNVVNAQTASYVLNVVSSSFATNSATASILSGFNQNDYLLISSFNLFTASYNTGSFSGSFTGSLLGTASFAVNATTASYYDTSSLLITASVTNATLTFTKGNGTTFNTTINNVVNAQTASTLTGFNQNDYVLTSSFNNFTASYNTGSFSGSFNGTASFATNAATASYYNTSSLLITSSVSNATITFTKGDNSSYSLTVNNVVNAQTASYVETAQTASFYNTSSLLITSSILNDTITFTKGNGSTYSLTVNNVSTSSYASNADLLDGRDSTTFAGTGSNTFNGNQIITGTLNVSSTISGTTALFTTITSSAITSSTLLSTNITGTYAQLLNLSGTTAQYTTISGSQITGSEIKTTTLSASYISASQIALTEYLDFNTAGTTPTYRQGRLYYNVDTQDPAYYTTVTNVAVNVGQQVVVKVKNSSGVSIAKGKLVHIVGGVGANPLIATASWENDNNSANTLGMTMNSMNQNDFGYVLLNGIITDVNTQGFTAGQILYLSSSGNYTGNKPQAPLHAVKVGEVVTVQQNNGVIFVNISNGQEIEELHDVRITSASSGDLLTYSSYNGTPVWVNTKTLSGSYVITGSLTISSSATFTNIGPAIFSGTINTNNILSGTTAQFTTITATSITGSITTASYAQNADLFDNRDSTTFAGTGSNTFTGIQNFNQNITGTHAYFSGDIVINGTASIGMLETRNQQSLIVGDKYIVIMSGATDHTTLDGSGILYGSGATGPTVDENGSNAYLRYRNSYDAVEAFPGFRVTGSLAVTNNSTFTTVSGTVARFTELTASLISGTITNALYSSNADLLDGRDSTSFAGLTGNTFSGNQIITGTLNVSNTISGTTALFTQITGNLFGTASYATTAGAVAGAPLLSANNTFTGINTFNTYYITGSITGSDAKFTSVSGTHVGSGTGLTSIPNAALVNSSVTIGTTAISLGSSVTTIQGVSVLTGSTITGSTALFTNTTSTTSIIGTGLYASNTTTTVVGNNAIYNVATASYDGMFIDYTARSGSNARAGQIMAIWSGSSVNYTETTTNDFGSTTGLAMAVVINGTNMQLSASASTANWTVKTIIRTI